MSPGLAFPCLLCVILALWFLNTIFSCMYRGRVALKGPNEVTSFLLNYQEIKFSKPPVEYFHLYGYADKNKNCIMK